jgi:nucleoside-diphosphate-sugar epimerase
MTHHPSRPEDRNERTESQTRTVTRPRLFLTGGSGYIGRNLIRHFVAKGAEVVALARTAKSAEVVRTLGAIPFVGDVLDKRLVEGMQGCQSLIHAAADTNHGRGTAQQSRSNVDGTHNVFTAARVAGIRRSVHISTEAVLLDGNPLINATEEHPYPRRPAGAYSRTKGEGERMALSLAAPDFVIAVVRPRFVWGRDDTTALPQLLAAAESGRLAWVSGGHYLTTTTHIANVCEGVDLALERGKSGQCYFITDGEPVEFRRFVTTLLGTQGIVVSKTSVPRWLVRAVANVGDFAEALSGGRITPPISLQVFATSAVEVTLDISKARNELGYKPVITLSEGIAELKAPPELMREPLNMSD